MNKCDKGFSLQKGAKRKVRDDVYWKEIVSNFQEQKRSKIVCNEIVLYYKGFASPFFRLT